MQIGLHPGAPIDTIVIKETVAPIEAPSFTTREEEHLIEKIAEDG